MSDSIFDDLSEGKEVALDFDSLRRHGIELVQKMAGNTWTDYNLHDPGVTILEALCYAITDMAYQTDFDITDQLTNKNGTINHRANSFFAKKNILTNNPVTVTDYRKAIIDDIDEVDNVWLTPAIPGNSVNAINGLYKIVVKPGIDYASQWAPGSAAEKKLKDKVKASFIAKRNLCEDVGDITILQPVKLHVKAEIQIDAVVVPEVALAQICYALQLAVNQPVNYSTERELLQQGYTIDEIYSGPNLKNGLITDADLPERLRSIDANNLIQTVSNVEGVVMVKSLMLCRTGDDNYTKLLTLNENEYGYLRVDLALPFDIGLVVDRYRITIRKNLFNDILQNILKAANRSFVRSMQADAELAGTFRDATTYYSLQNYFPLVYGIGQEGLLSSAP